MWLVRVYIYKGRKDTLVHLKLGKVFDSYVHIQHRLRRKTRTSDVELN